MTDILVLVLKKHRLLGVVYLDRISGHAAESTIAFVKKNLWTGFAKNVEHINWKMRKRNEGLREGEEASDTSLYPSFATFVGEVSILM